MLYSCTRMATVVVVGLIVLLMRLLLVEGGITVAPRSESTTRLRHHSTDRLHAAVWSAPCLRSSQGRPAVL